MKDKERIEDTIRLLLEHNCKAVGNLNLINKFSTWDLSGLTVEKPFVIEIKNKKCRHDKYKDVFCDKYKYDEFKKQDYYKSMLVVNYYSDGYVAIANPDHGYKVKVRKTPITTEFGEKGEEISIMISMKQEKLFKIE